MGLAGRQESAPFEVGGWRWVAVVYCSGCEARFRDHVSAFVRLVSAGECRATYAVSVGRDGAQHRERRAGPRCSNKPTAAPPGVGPAFGFPTLAPRAGLKREDLVLSFTVDVHTSVLSVGADRPGTAAGAAQRPGLGAGEGGQRPTTAAGAVR